MKIKYFEIDFRWANEDLLERFTKPVCGEWTRLDDRLR